jgi:hypothetical protein
MAANVRGSRLFGKSSESLAVGRQSEVRHSHRGEHGHQQVNLRPQQRLAAGDSYLFEAMTRPEGEYDVDDLVVGQHICRVSAGRTGRRRAVRAAQGTAVGHRDPD